MQPALDYATSATPDSADDIFLTRRIAPGLKPTLVVDAGRAVLGPERLTARAIALHSAWKSIATVAAIVVGWRVMFGGWTLVALPIVFGIAVAGIFGAFRLKAWQRSARSADWLVYAAADDRVSLPVAGTSFVKSAVARVEFVSYGDGEIRLIVRSDKAATRVGVVRDQDASLASVATALARSLAVPIYEYEMLRPGRAIVHRTEVGGERTKLLA